jgi:type II secretory pathway pseudopilin PulG
MRQRHRLAFTWVELLLVLAIVIVAAGMLLPAILHFRNAHTRVRTMSLIKQVGLTIHNCQDTHKRLPPAWGEFPPRARADEPQTSARATVHAWLLPFCAQDILYRELMTRPPAGSNIDKMRRVWRLSLASEVVPVFASPLDFTAPDGTVNLGGAVYGVQNIAANIRVFGPLTGDGAQPGVLPASDAFDGVATIPGTFTDGTSNVITFATRYGRCGAGASTWSQPGTATLQAFGGTGGFFGSNISPALSADGDNTSGDDTAFQVMPSEPGVANPCNPVYAQSFRPDAIYVSLGDGSMRAVAPTISAQTWARVVIPNDGFVLPADW